MGCCEVGEVLYPYTFVLNGKEDKLVMRYSSVGLSGRYQEAFEQTLIREVRVWIGESEDLLDT